MQKYLVFAYLVGSLVACRAADNTGKDLGVSTDMAAPPGSDLSASSTDMARNYIAGTPHDIDTSGPTGPYSANAPVAVTDLIAISDVRFFLSKGKTICSYEVYVQDPACVTPPCGIVLKTDGGMAVTTSPNCPGVSTTTTPLKDVKLGDKLSAKGLVNVYQDHPTVDGGAGGTMTQHGLENISSVVISASNQTLPTGVAANPADFFDSNSLGWAKYESTRVTFSNVTVASVGTFGSFHTNPNYLSWGGDYDNNYRFFLSGDAGVYPNVNQTFKSLTGFVSSFPLAAGKFFAVQPADFVP